MSAVRNGPLVTLLNRQRARKLDSRRLRKITLALLDELKVREAELGVTFVADEEMTLVNETFLQHEGSIILFFLYSIDCLFSSSFLVNYEYVHESSNGLLRILVQLSTNFFSL